MNEEIQNDDQVELIIVYQKEPHAGQMAFEHIAQPVCLDQRTCLARRMKREYQLPSTILIDSMKDQSRALFGDLPSPAFIIDPDGIVAAKFPWADGDILYEALYGEVVE